MNQRVKDAIVCLLFFGLALVVRLFLLKYRQCIETDGVAYVNVAREFVEYHRFTNHLYPPLYPALIGAVSLIGGNYELAGRLVSALCGSLLVFPVFALARGIYGLRAGCFAAMLLVFYPPLVDYSTAVLSESTYLFFVYLFLLTIFHAFRSHRLPLFALAGVLIGLSYLIRPEALAYLGFAVFCYGCRWLYVRREVALAKFAVNSACLAGAAILLVVPYMVYSGGVSGKTQAVLAFSDTVGRADFVRGVDETLQVSGGQGAASIGGELVRHPVKIFKRSLMNLHLVHKYVLPDLFPVLIVCLVVMGLTRMRASYEEWFILLSCVPLAGMLVLFVDTRFFLPMVPVAMIFGARGLELIVDRLTGFMKGRWGGVMGVVLPAVVVVSLLPFTLRAVYRPDENVTYRAAGSWLKANVQGPMKVMERKPWVAFYADAERVYFPVGSWEEVLRYARSNGATHMVIDDRVVPEVRKEMAFLLYPEFAPAALKLVRQFSAPGAARVLLYEFVKVDSGSVVP